MSDLQNSIPILEKRKLQAEVAKSIFDEMKKEFGDKKAREILKNAIIKNAIGEGIKFRKEIETPKAEIEDQNIECKKAHNDAKMSAPHQNPPQPQHVRKIRKSFNEQTRIYKFYTLIQSF